MINHVERRVFSLFLAVVMLFSILPTTAFAKSTLDTTVLDGKISITTTGGTAGQRAGSVSKDGSITIGATPVTNCGKFKDTADHIVTITNISTEELMLEFAYGAFDNVGKLVIDGVVKTTPGTYSKTLAVNGTIIVKLTTNKDTNPTSIKLSDFELKDTGTKSVTVTKTEGGKTAVNGTNLSEASTTVNTDYATGVTLAATPASGYVFVAWLDSNYNVVSTKANDVIHPLESMMVGAYFVENNTQAYWLAGGTLHTDLAAACAAAQGGDKQVVLLKSATLPRGNYEIPEGITVLIPKDELLTSYGADPALATNGAKWKAPTAYRTLTMEDGANLVVNGTLELAAMHHVSSGSTAVKYGGAIDGAYAHIKMESGSNIRINGTMYAWGMVTGSGTVDVYGTIYEKMQVNDYRGGGVTSTIALTHKSRKLFPFSQYYVQNVEVPETIYSGGKLMVHCGVYLSAPESATVEFVGNNGMFRLSEETYVTKEYIASTDRLQIDLYGDAVLGSIGLNFEGNAIDSANFRLGINNNIDIHVHSGVTQISQAMILQSGATVTVDKDATLYNTTEVFIMDADEWGTYARGTSLMPVKWSYSNGTTVKRSGVTDAIVDINGTVLNDGQIYSTGSESVISSKGTGVYVVANPANSSGSFYQVTSNDNTNILITQDWVEISATPAVLVNGDKTTVTAAGGQYDAFIYDTFQDKWIKQNIYNGGSGYTATITYDPNGAEYTTNNEAAVPVTKTVDYLTTVGTFAETGVMSPLAFALEQEIFTRSGYIFQGWGYRNSVAAAETIEAVADETSTDEGVDVTAIAADESFDKTFKSGDIVTISGDTTLYAVWEGQPFNLYWNGEVNEIAAGTDLSQVLGEDVNLFQFYTDAEYTTEYTLTDGKMPACHLYVKEKALYAVTVDGEVKTENYAEGAYLNTLLGEFYTGKTVEDFNFYYDAECTKPVKIVDGKMPAHALYAKSLYSVTVVDTNSGAVLAKWNLEAGTKLAEKLESITVSAPENKKFEGWYIEDVKIDDTTEMPAKDIEIQALYAELFTVTFKVNGSDYGDPFYADVNNQYKINIGNPEGENFGGWQDSDGKLYQKGDTITLTENLVLNAHFHADTDPKDHKCDGCDKTGMGTHADGTDNDHVCDYCQGAVDGEVCRGGTATCSAKAICEECGQPYGELDETAHAYAAYSSGYVSNNNATHSAKYVCANNKEHFKTGETEPCEFYEGVCQECGFECPHENKNPEDHGCNVCGFAVEHCSDVAVFKEGVAAGCHSTGRADSWYCEYCDVYYLDEDCTQVTNYKRLTIPAQKDTADHAPAKAATCTEGGNLEYWFCDECDQVWEDEALTKLSSPEKMQIGALGHSFKTVDAQTATCVAEGNLEHKQCETCKLYFAADAGTDSTAGQAENTAFITPKDSSNHTNKLKYTNNGDGTHSSAYECCQAPGVTNEKHVYGSTDNVCKHCDQTRIRFILYDGWYFKNAGWNGNGVNVYKNGEFVTFLTLTNKNEESKHYVEEYYPTDEYELYWVEGESDPDCSRSTVMVSIGGREMMSHIQDEIYKLADGQRLYPECYKHVDGEYIVNTNGTHTLKCGDCFADIKTENHDYTSGAAEHTCKCGAVETFPMHFYLNDGDATSVATLQVPFGTALQTESYEATDELKALAEEASKSLTTTPTKDHYTYKGWLIDGVATTTMPAEDVTIYANWIAVEYKITYDLNGGQFKDSVWRYDESAIYGEWFYLNAKNEPDVFPVEREGYTFTHFLDQKDAKYEPECNGFTGETRHWLVGVMPGYDLTLTAQWEINQYTITFENTGDKEYAPITMDYGEDIDPIANPEKAGYKFVGWTDENGNSVSIPATMPGKNMTLTAQWEINRYTLTFLDEEGKPIGNPVSYEVGAKVTATYPNYSKQNYEISWDAKIPATMPANDVVIKAVAKPKTYTIVFGEIPLTAKEDNNWTVTVPEDPTQAGYTFAGWATTEDAAYPDTGYNAGDQVAFTESKTFYPVFEALNFTVTLNGNGGLFGNEATWFVKAPCGTEINYANVQPVREGYDFRFWSKDEAGKDPVNALPNKIPTADATYYAQWTVKQVTVKFNQGETQELTGNYFETVIAPKLNDTESHIFLGWAATASDDAEVLYKGGDAITLNNSVAENTFIAKWEAKKFDVIYYVDGTVVHRVTYAYDAPVTQWEGYVPAEGLIFNGWSGIPATMPAKNVEVYGTTTVKTYTITWLNEAGSVIDTTTVEYGKVPAHADPTKESDAQYSYKFSGWYPDIVAAKSEATYTASFTPVLRSYDITFVVDGQQNKVVSTEYGKAPVYDADNKVPTKASDTQYSYTFAGWMDAKGNVSKELPEITGEATFTATWTETPMVYTVTFKIGDKVHFFAEGGYGTQIDYTGFNEAPTETGYEFSGWSMAELPMVFPAENLVIIGSFIPKEFAITFKGDFNTEKDDAFADYILTKKFGEAITESDIAALEEKLPSITGWEFLGWFNAEEEKHEENEEPVLVLTSEFEIPATMGAENVTVYADWEAIPYELIVRSSIDGVQIGFGTMNYEESYEDEDNFNFVNNFCYDSNCDAKNHDAMHTYMLPEGYTFEGYKYADGTDMIFPIECWPADHVTIEAQFKPIDYTITFHTNGGEPAAIAPITAPYGTQITLPEDPTKTGYNFAGWMDADGNAVDLTTMPLKGAEVYAKWTEGIAIFRFFAYQGATTAYATFEVQTGSDLLTETPDNPETNDVNEYVPSILKNLLTQVEEMEVGPKNEGHTFLNWITDAVPATMPAQGVSVYGNWQINSYTVTADGVPYSFEYGAPVSIPNPTNKEGYEFQGWIETVPTTMPDHDVVLTAKWNPIPYSITFDVAVCETITAPYGTQIVWPANPSKTGYTFLGWSTDGETVIENLPESMPAGGLNLKAVWQTNTVVITWIIEGVETVETYQYGQTMAAPKATKAADAKWTYKFDSWSPALPENGTATVNETYTAQFAEDEKVTYAVKFVDPADDTYSYSTRMAWDAQVNLEALEGFTAPTQTGKTLSWTVNGTEVTFPYQMSTTDVTFLADWTPILYSIKFYHNATDTEPVHVISGEYGAPVSYEYIAPTGYEFTGWVLKETFAPYRLEGTMPAENLELVAVTKAKSFDVIFVEDGSETIRKSVTYNQQVPDETPTTTKGEGYTFQGWFDAEGVKLDWNYTMPARSVTFTAKWTYTGWFTDEKGTTYLENDVKKYYGVATIGNARYCFDSEGYLIKDITLIDGEYHAFDHDTGVFLSNLTDVYTASNGDIYYVENGIAAANKGLVKTTDEYGYIHYYYFGCAINSNCPSGYQCDAYKAQRNCVHWVENNNGMLVKWDYKFDENGVIEHQEDTSLNGIQTINGTKFYLIDGVKVHKGLFKEGEYYYYARSSGELVVNRNYWITNLNGLNDPDMRIHEGTYTFDAEGRMILEEVFNGICEKDGKLFYYLNGTTNYAGLIRYSGDLIMANGTVKKGFYKNDYLYVRASGELAQGRYWITKNNDLMESKNYEFDSYGRMDMTDGLITVDGVRYYYQDGTPFYAGLIEIEGDYYYVKTSGQLVTGCSYWITKTNGLMPEKSYNFDESGKILNPDLIDSSKDGIVEENGTLYYYRDGAPYYAGLIKIGNNYYYVKTSGEVVRGQKYWITKNNDLMKSRSYTFDENGVMLDPAPLA